MKSFITFYESVMVYVFPLCLFIGIIQGINSIHRFLK